MYNIDINVPVATNINAMHAQCDSLKVVIMVYPYKP